MRRDLQQEGGGSVKINRALKDGGIVSIDRISGDVDGNIFVVLHAADMGGCEIGLARETAGLRRLWVAPQYRSKGLGTALLQLALDETKRHGKLALSWQVKKDNARAILFYLRAGAAIVHDDGDGYYWMSITTDADFDGKAVTA